MRGRSKGCGQVVADKEAIVADFQLMGDGLVRHIEVLAQTTDYIQ